MSPTRRLLKMEQHTAEGEIYLSIYFFSSCKVAKSFLISPVCLNTVSGLDFNVCEVPQGWGEPPLPRLIGHSARDSWLLSIPLTQPPSPLPLLLFLFFLLYSSPPLSPLPLFSSSSPLLSSLPSGCAIRGRGRDSRPLDDESEDVVCANNQSFPTPPHPLLSPGAGRPHLSNARPWLGPLIAGLTDCQWLGGAALQRQL